MSEIAAIQYRSVTGGWFTAKQVMRARDEQTLALEPRADFLRRAERERAFYAKHTPDTEWRIFVPMES